MFWDNASVHRSRVVQEYLETEGIACVFNVPYAPQYNGIERLWALTKQNYRKQLTELKRSFLPFDNPSVVRSAIASVTNEEVACCARNGWNSLGVNEEKEG